HASASAVAADLGAVLAVAIVIASSFEPTESLPTFLPTARDQEIRAIPAIFLKLFFPFSTSGSGAYRIPPAAGSGGGRESRLCPSISGGIPDLGVPASCGRLRLLFSE